MKGVQIFWARVLRESLQEIGGRENLAKVTKPPPQDARRRRYENDKSDLWILELEQKSVIQKVNP